MARKRKTKDIEGITYYYCTKCKNYFKIDNFEIRHDNKTPRSHCKDCRKLESAYYHRTVRLRMTKEQALLDINKGLKYKIDPLISLKKYILRLTKNSAKLRNLEHSLTIEDIEIPNKCPILETEFKLNNRNLTYSVDRIDNNLGYVKGNVMIISNLANTMKQNATVEQLQSFSKNIMDYVKR